MIRSLYVRVTAVFLAAVTLSLIPSFYLATSLYGDHIQNVIAQSMIDSGKKVIQSYEASPPDNRDTLMKGVTALPSMTILLFGQDGKLLHGGDSQAAKRLHLGDEELQAVLSGSVYRGEGHERPVTVGLPFQIDGERYALFLAPEIKNMLGTVGDYLQIGFLLALLFGSLFILLAARYIVRPLQLLTRATRKMAKGDFSIRLASKRKDEIGQLTQSFNQMANELGDLEAIRRQFVSDVSHEIQSPLTSIKGFTHALLHKKMDEAARRRLLGIIEEESNRLSRLSEDLLQLASLEYEHLRLNVETFLLDKQLRHVVVALEPQWASKELEMELEADQTTMRGDRDKLNQLWVNLLGNAVKFTPEGGRIRIAVRCDEQNVRVTIADSGPGISEHEQEHIFKPFYKVDKSRDRAVGGNGIGLSIVKRIVDLHRGDIQVLSRVGEGTNVTVTLPLDPPEQNF
ncbi:sensor histidine kinase [Cohnella cellulosilytica]|uniref:Heme sensor protein HssS n=1 Tax=Cohnella cellulosilytica TaxID=986710 RepID=A0ABW2F433_9BACL